MTDWTRVGKPNPCPICHKTDWCGYTVDAVHCMRIPSDRPPLPEGGWIHRLSDPIPAYQRPPPRDEMLRPCFDTLWRGWRSKTNPGLLDEYARALVVSDQALHALGAAWAPEHGAWAFPMRDGSGKIDHPNYLHVPLEQLRERLGELPKDKKIVAVCQVGVRSYEAQRALAGKGFQRATFLAGGMNVWLRSK